MAGGGRIGQCFNPNGANKLPAGCRKRWNVSKKMDIVMHNSQFLNSFYLPESVANPLYSSTIWRTLDKSPLLNQFRGTGMQDLASESDISAVINEYFFNGTHREVSLTEHIGRRRILIFQRKRKRQLCYLLLSHHQQNSLQLDLHSPHWGLIQIVSECFYLVIILSQCSFFTLPHCGDKMKTTLILK